MDAKMSTPLWYKPLTRLNSYDNIYKLSKTGSIFYRKKLMFLTIKNAGVAAQDRADRRLHIEK